MRRLWPVVCFLASGLVAPASADVVTDGSVGARVRLAGDFEIGADLGTRAGRNLFHSFGRFSLDTGERATFSGPDQIRNVISRVTGGARSDIDGTIASTIPGADFYFLNPAGVVFGPNASLDLQGSFHVSTADELRFSDGAKFSATNPAASSFTVAAPEAFGFLGGRPGRITVDGSTLAVPGEDGRALSLLAGEVGLQGGTVFANRVLVAAQQAEAGVPVRPEGPPVPRDGGVTLTADEGGGAAIFSSGPRGGSIRIEGGQVTVDDSNLFDLNPSDLDSEGGIAVGAQSLTVLGQNLNAGLQTGGTGRGRAGSITIITPQIRVAGGTIASSRIDSGSAPAGDITIHADRVELGNLATIVAPVPPAVDPDVKGGTVRIRANDALTLRDSSLVSSNTAGQGDGGSIVIEAGRLEVATASGALLSSSVSASTFSSGNAGSLKIEASEILVDNGFISAGVGLTATGAGGVIDITADHVVLRDTGFVEASTLGAGDGGRVTITAEEGIEITSGGIVSASTADTGRGGTIAITTPRLDLDDGRINASTLGSRNAGSITIRAGEVRILDEGQINSSTFGEGDGGDIFVKTGTLLADATRPDTRLATGIVASATRMSGGAAGNVRIVADEIRLLSGSEISSVTQGRGPGGSLRIEAGTLVIDGAQVLATTEREAQDTADAGSVAIRAGSLQILDTGLLSTGTSGPGDGGDLTVEAGIILIDGTRRTSSDLFTGIESAAQEGSTGRSGNVVVRAGVLEIGNDAGIANSTLGPGDGGRLRVEAGVIRLRDNGNIVSSSFSDEPGAGDAGQLTVVARERLRIDNAFIGTESVAAGGGQITLEVGELLFLTDAGEISSSVFGGAGTTAGDITIDPRFIVLDGSSIIAQAREGRGGNIRITADNLILSPDSVISASAGPAGIDGTIVISTPEVDLSGGLVVLEGALLDASSQLRERCGARRDIGASSFTGVGRGGLPPTPDGPLASAYATSEVALGGMEPRAGSRPMAGMAAASDVRLAGLTAPCAPLE
jgi:filamentous hemagglutinin family protein